MIGKWLFKQFMKFHIFMYRRSGGTRMGRVRGMPVLLLNTVGRKSGVRRTTPVMYFKDGDNYVITASNSGEDSHPDWWLNLQANPQTTIEVGGKTLKVVGQQASPEEKTRLWAQLVEQAPFFDEYRKRTSRDIPVVVLRPEG